MNHRRIVAVAAIAVLTGILAFAVVSPTTAQKIARVSDVLDVREKANVTAVIPDVKAFLQALREGDTMRAFFDSPLGLHFLKSAPARSAAHLHRLIAVAPKSWQWNLYALISDGPVLYRSTGKTFTLAIRLSAKGKILTSLLPLAHAQKSGDWFLIASDKEALASAVAYLAKPVAEASPMDPKLNASGALTLFIQPSQKSNSLTRALIGELTGIDNSAACSFTFTPAANSIGIEGDCATKAASQTALKSEQIAAVPYAAYAYYRRPADRVARIMAVEGFSIDYGYVIPRMFYSGPAADNKSIEYLSQVFKTRNHTVETKNGALQILYPRNYAGPNNKYEIFAPILSANSDRFYWYSVGAAGKNQTNTLAVNADYAWYISINPHALVVNSQEALKQFDPIYSPGHFSEFRDALFKSLPTLKKTIFTMYAKPSGKNLKIGGSLQFAEN